MRRSVLGVGLAVFLVVLAGCSSYPFGDPPAQDEPAPVKLVNNETMTETFEVAVVDVGENLTLTSGNNTTVNVSVPEGSWTLYRGELHQVRLPESARMVGQYTLEPGESTLIHVKGVAPDQAIVVFVYDEPEGQYRGIKSVSCAGAITGFRVTAQKGGDENWIMSTHGCNNWF